MSTEWSSLSVGDVVAERAFPPFTHDDLRRYAEASGDTNPLHLDPVFARQAGFNDVIVHGMLGMAFLGRLVSEQSRGGRILSLRTRFRGVIHVGQPLNCVARFAELSRTTATLTLEARGPGDSVLVEGTATVDLSGRG
jgi:acyl dehydratase